jgi:hypothetical protein
MKGISGNLSSLSITDLVQWIEISKKSGALFVSNESSSKCFCFNRGKLLFAASKEEGGKFGDIMSNECNVPSGVIRKAISESKKQGVSFIRYMVDNRIISEEFVSAAIKVLAERNIIDILSWSDGSFEFTEALPSYILESPINVNAGYIVFESVRKYDEILRDKKKMK